MVLTQKQNSRIIVVYGDEDLKVGPTNALLAKYGFANAFFAGSFESMARARPQGDYRTELKDTDPHAGKQVQSLRFTNYQPFKGAEGADIEPLDIRPAEIGSGKFGLTPVDIVEVTVE